MIIGLVALALCVPALVGAQTQVVALGAAQLTTITPVDTTEGKVFVFAVSVPSAPTGARLMSAVLELVVDVSSSLPAAARRNLATLEVAPLNGALSGPAVSEEDLRPTTMKRSVPIGTNRPVRVDVTEFVRYVLDNPEENYGIAVGSLEGSRSDRFELRSQGQEVARLTIRYLPANQP